MKLIDVYKHKNSAELLYQLLQEREQHQCISHKELPSFINHLRFVDSRPYLAWYLVELRGTVIGATYLTKQREIGIFLFTQHQMMGYGAKAVQLLMQTHPGMFLANIAPTNPGSAEFFKNLGFKHIQNTYQL
ncbi:GNAT domain containing protein [uncultured Caudovirales phage]|uniref:GNAT domain containing protein n=1 Tax=uncultured Caudovirales phage TaxID=2100421 RepID=A0A6J7X162_9CAUD|nr:GNAT domain containing protein [uncultured Caudovirales phage]